MENISVSVRLRSLSKLEERERCVWKVDGRCVVHVDGEVRRDADSRRDNDARRSGTYIADHVFGPECDNDRVYQEAVEGLVHDAVEGKNVTIMVYGQTGSGKTHTMGTPEAPGIVQRALMDIFDLISQKEDRDYLLRFSYLEIYNENVTDLLSPEKVPKPLLIKEDRVVGPVVLGLSEELVTSPEDVLRLLRQGEAKRHVAASKMNEHSNRSHAVSRMVLESRPAGSSSSASTPVIVSNLVLVDLAGSESVAKTGAEGERLKESSCINKSLLALGEVVYKLSEGALAAGAHIPYRDSKLTRILKPSLGGNAKTMIVCTINPAARHVEESHRTLRFACRAKRVVNTVVVNEVAAEAAAARWQAKALKELQRRRAEGTVASSEDVRAQIKALRTELLRSEEQRARAAREAEVARQLMVHTFDMAAAAAAAGGGGGGGGGTSSETPTRPHSHSYVRTRSWSPSRPLGGAPPMEAAAAVAWASPGLAPALAARAAAAPPLRRPASAGSTSEAEGRLDSREDVDSLLGSLSVARGNDGGGAGAGAGGGGGGGSDDCDGGPEGSVSVARMRKEAGAVAAGKENAEGEDGGTAGGPAPPPAAPQSQPPAQQGGNASHRGRRPTSSPTHFPSPSRLQEAVELWRIENRRLWHENSQLREELQPKLKQELQWLTATIATHEALNAQLQSERDAALQLVDGLQMENAELQRALAELHRQLQIQTARSATGSQQNNAPATAGGAVVPYTVPYTLDAAAAALAGEVLTAAAVEELEAALAATTARAEELEALVVCMQGQLEAAHGSVEEARGAATQAVAEAQERVARGEAETEELRAQLGALLDEVEALRGRLQVCDVSNAYRTAPPYGGDLAPFDGSFAPFDGAPAPFDMLPHRRPLGPHPWDYASAAAAAAAAAANIEAAAESLGAAIAMGSCPAGSHAASRAASPHRRSTYPYTNSGGGSGGGVVEEGGLDMVRFGDTDTISGSGQAGLRSGAPGVEDFGMEEDAALTHPMLSPYPYLFPAAAAAAAAGPRPDEWPSADLNGRARGPSHMLHHDGLLQPLPELPPMLQPSGRGWKAQLQSVPELGAVPSLDDFGGGGGESEAAEAAVAAGALEPPPPHGCRAGYGGGRGTESPDQQQHDHAAVSDMLLLDLDDGFEPALEPVDVLQELCMQYAAAAAAAAAAADPNMTETDLRASAEEAQATAAVAAAAARQRVTEELQAVRASAAAAVAAAADEMAEVAAQQDVMIAELRSQLTEAVAESEALRQQLQRQELQLLQHAQAQPQASPPSSARESELTAALEAALEAAEVALLKAEARAAALADERDALRERLQKLLAAGAAAAAAAAEAAALSTPGEGEEDGEAEEEEEGGELGRCRVTRRPALTPSPWPEEWKTPREEPWDTHTIWGFPGGDDTWRSADAAKGSLAVPTVSVRDAEVAQLREEVAALQTELSRTLEERMAAEEQIRQLRAALEDCQGSLRGALAESSALQAEAQQRAVELSGARRAVEEREAKLAALRATLLVCELPSKLMPASGPSPAAATGSGSGAAATSRKPSSTRDYGCPSAKPATPPPPAATAAMTPKPAAAPPAAAAAAAAAAAGGGGTQASSAVPSAGSGVKGGMKPSGATRAQGLDGSGGGGTGGGNGSGGGAVAHRRVAAVRGAAAEVPLRRSRGLTRVGPPAAAANGSLMAVAAAAARRRYAADSLDGVGTEEEATPPAASRMRPALARRLTVAKSRTTSSSSSLVSELFERLDRLERLHQSPPPQPPPQQQQQLTARRRLPRASCGAAAAAAAAGAPPRRRAYRRQLLDVKAQLSTAGCGLQLLAPGVEKVDAAVSYPPPREGPVDPSAPTRSAAATSGAAAAAAAPFPAVTAHLTITLRGA